MKKVKFGLLILLVGSASVCFGNRTVTFYNNCSQNIWLGISGGSVGAAPHTGGDTVPCESDADCFTKTHSSATHCVAESDTSHICYWNSPLPGASGTASDYQLIPGQQKTVSIPTDASYNGQFWSGAIAGRTGCTGSGASLQCETADCGSASCGVKGGWHGILDSITGFSTPFTKPEITMLANGPDTYDVSMVDGYNNVSIEFKPTPGQILANAPSSSVPNFSKYWCSNPGGSTSTTGLPACTWNLNINSSVPNFMYYRFVSGDGTVPADTCTSDSSCTGGQVCGLPFVSGNTNSQHLRCGKLLGYATPNAVCKGTTWTQTGVNDPFNCTQTTAVNPPYAHISNVYACDNSSVTCYQGSGITPPANCCGCSDWSGLGVLPTASCNNVTSGNLWTVNAYPKDQLFKAACPTAYSYQFDDPSSTFQCQTPGTNNTNYTVTYCPENPNPPTPIPPNGGPAGGGSSNHTWMYVAAAAAGVAIGTGMYFIYSAEENKKNQPDVELNNEQ